MGKKQKQKQKKKGQKQKKMHTYYFVGRKCLVHHYENNLSILSDEYKKPVTVFHETG